jgi:hypothetical protein
VTRHLADTSRHVATRLEEGGVQGVGDDLRRFARRQPGLFLAAAGLAGFVVTRMLRSAQADGPSNGVRANGYGNGQYERPAAAVPRAQLDTPFAGTAPPETLQ